jgi:Ca-activated chloride channel family protein
MYPLLAASAVLLLTAAAERLHARRSRVMAALAFGPSRRPAPWAHAAPWLRVLAMSGLCWGLVTLMLEPPKIRKAGEIPPGEERHLLLVLDVSPSMRLQDAGPDAKQSRMKRASALLNSFFERTAIETYKISVVATYTEAKPVVVATKDMDVINNILGDLPMHFAFSPGATNLFAGLDEAIKIAKPWRPGSTTMVIISDGDTVPAVGMPKLPPSITHVLVVGVGDPQTGRFIDGHQSRQDTSTLRQVAIRLGGTYHNGNEKHLPTDILRQITLYAERSVFEKLTRREYALIVCGVCATVLALLPLLLHLAGTGWRPGVAGTLRVP